MSTSTLAIGALFLAACSGDAKPKPPEPSFDAALPPSPDAAPVVRDISEATGVPAWQAVHDRARYLERRGGAGAVVGRLESRTGEQRWLVDESQGQGTLAIRVALPGFARSLADGELLELRGAWAVDADRRWFWRATEVARVVDAEPVTFPYEPGLVVNKIDAPPQAAVPASAAASGATIVFTVVAAPSKPGDGWLIADSADAKGRAWLVLPGEGAAYGGQDMLADGEQWKLIVGRRYTVKIARRPRRSAGLHLLIASGPPRELR